MARVTLPKFSIKDFEPQLQIAAIGHLTGVNYSAGIPTSDLRVTSDSVVGVLQKRITDYATELFEEVFFSPEFGNDSGRGEAFARPKLYVEHVVDREGTRLVMESQFYAVNDAGSSHKLFYILDEGVPETTFSKGSALFPLKNYPPIVPPNYRTRQGGLRVSQQKAPFVKLEMSTRHIGDQTYQVVTGYSFTRDADEATKVRFEAGDTRAAQPGNRWSKTIADLLESKLNGDKLVRDNKFKVSVNYVPFGGGENA